MRNIKFGVLLSVALSVVGISYLAFSEEKEATLKGEIVDLSCYLGHGEKGASHKQCAIKCAKKGIPIGILDEKSGIVYLILPGHSKKDMEDYKALGEKKSGTVVELTGTLVEEKSISAIVLGGGHDH